MSSPTILVEVEDALRQLLRKSRELNEKEQKASAAGAEAAVFKLIGNVVEGAVVYGDDTVEVRLSSFRPLVQWYARRQIRSQNPRAVPMHGPFDKK